jgi:hypothetical protein
MCERRELVDKVVTLVSEVQSVFPSAEVFPRFVTECCDRHMSKDDVVMMDGIRRDVDRDMMETVREHDRSVTFFKWWEVLGFENDMTSEKQGGFELWTLDKDGVHLTEKANRMVAGYLCLW